MLSVIREMEMHFYDCKKRLTDLKKLLFVRGCSFLLFCTSFSFLYECLVLCLVKRVTICYVEKKSVTKMFKEWVV